MAVAQYVFPNLAVFTNAVNTIQNTPLTESDVNGLWNSAILPVYFPYRNNIQYALKPEFTHGNDRYDILVARQAPQGAPPVTVWTWFLIFEGKGPNAVTWDVLRAQVAGYLRNSGRQRIYAVGAIGRFCKFWEWAPNHLNEEFQLTVNAAGNVVPQRGQFNPFDVVNDSINVERCIRFVIANMP